MNADSQLRPDSRRLQSLRRARARAGLAAEPTKEDAEIRSPWQKLALHPVALLVIGGLVGLTSGLATSFYSAQRELDQYWREERITTYQEYHAAYAALYDVTNPATVAVLHDPRPAQRVVAEQNLTEIKKRARALDEKKRRFDLVASDRMANFALQGYDANWYMYSSLVRLSNATTSDGEIVREEMRAQVEESRFLEEPVWPETFLSEAKKDLGTT